MLIVPVLDILDGRVVRGIAGRRTEYRPIVSRLTSSCDPLDVANSMRDSFGLERFYVADLDGIVKQQPDLRLYHRLTSAGFELLVDSGVSEPDDAISLIEAGVDRIIVGLESCRSPEDLARIAERAAQVTFSLDLLSGQPRRRIDAQGWSDDPHEIVRQAVEAMASEILPLDLADVGMGTGGSTDLLCRFIRDKFPTVTIIAGGGVRGPEDLRRFSDLGVDAVLVASALHDGRLVRGDIVDYVSR